MDWAEFLKVTGAITGTALGVWNLIAASRTGVSIQRRPANVLIVNSGTRPVCVDVIGFIQSGTWKAESASIELHSIDEAGLPRQIDPWRSVSYALNLHAELASQINAGTHTYWFAHMENGAIASTVPWYRPDHCWRLRRSVRRAHLEDPFFHPGPH